MKEIKGNLFEIECDALCITTNGFVKSNSECVMGKGCAKQFTKFVPTIAKTLGDAISLNGNVTQVMFQDNKHPTVLAFPVKPIGEISDGTNAVAHMQNKMPVGCFIPGWACKAKLDIIVSSAHALITLTDAAGWKTVLVPRPGCGAGELLWSDVYPVLRDILDDRFVSVTFK